MIDPKYILNKEDFQNVEYKRHFLSKEDMDIVSSDLRKGGMMFSNDTYNRIKWVAQYFLPALGTLCYLVCGIWNISVGSQIVGTIVALDTALGVLLGISSANYNGDGVMIVDTSNPERDIYRMELNDPVDNLANKTEVTFKVMQGQLGD